MGFESENISYEQLLELISQLSIEDKKRLIQDLTSKRIEEAILEDFKKYEATFRALT